MKPMIYIVEDDRDVRESLRLLLEVNDYSVEDFGSGMDLLAFGEPSKASCIIMDVNLPGESGLKTFERLLSQSVATPVLIVSGRADERVRLEAQRLNAAGFLEKPILGQVLLDTIKSIQTPRQ